MFREGSVKKYYWALTAVSPEPPEGELVHFLKKNENQNRSYAYPVAAGARVPEGAKEARLRYKTLEQTERYWLIEVELLTGRHHQIRCQLSAIGCPIKGDLKYGARRSNQDGGISLHARRLSLIHPVTKEPLTVEAPVDWSPILKR